MATVLVAGAAGCRSGGGKNAEIQNIALTDVGGYVEFQARQREHEQKSKVGAGDRKTKETLLEESVAIDVDGYSYHPNLLEFTLGGVFGLLQHDYEEIIDGRRESSGDDGELLEFDLEGRFFKKKPYPGMVFARQRRAIEPRPFQPSIETTTTSYGLNWQYVDETFPTSLQLSHTDVQLDSFGPDEEDGRNKNTNARFETAYRISSANQFTFTFDHQEIEQQPFELNYETDEFTLAHNWNFGDRKQFQLDSELNHYRQTGSFSIERTRWREDLRIDHTDTLRSWHRFEALEREQGSLAGVPPIKERSLLFSSTLEHELYESLVSRLHGFVNDQEYESGANIERYGGQISFDYRKNNPWGMLLANYRARVQRENRSGNEFSNEVLDEQHTFNDPEPVILRNDSVVTGSIHITALDELTVYQVGRDYTVRRVGNIVEIERVVTGRILDGQSVLIDYLFSGGGDFTLDTLAHEFRVRQNFEMGLSPYYRFQWQDQTISPADATGVLPEDITDHLIGMEYRWKAFRVGAEHQDHDSTINPYRAIRMTADYTHRWSYGATGVLKGRWSDTDFREPNERSTRFWTVEGRYRHPVDRNLILEGAAIYRAENDSLSGKEDGIDLDFSLEWNIRQTEVRLTYEYSMIDDEFSDNNHSAVFLQVRRKF